MKEKQIIPVILCGGNGTRLWPLSREQYPKQFLSLQGNVSMLQATISRLANLKCSEPIVVCNDKHRFIVAEQLKKIGKLSNNIVLEPEGKNTAPAIALSAFIAEKITNISSAILLVLAADHIIENESVFIETIKKTISLAQLGKLVTFGITPRYAETGYGYIHRGNKVNNNDVIAYQVSNFVEKPNLTLARKYLKNGEYYWNSGMFLFRADIYLKELKKYRPEIYQICLSSVKNIGHDLDFIRINASQFNKSPSESIDCAVMENTSDAVVVPMDVGWSDVGSWESLWDVSSKDEHGNFSKGNVISFDAHDNYIYAESSLVTTLGIENLIVVQTKDALLVADKKKSQEVKLIVDKLKNENLKEYSLHREVHRPWGKYNYLCEGVGYQVKHILVNPGESLSLQMHYYRVEHWIVISGTAKVQINSEEKIISENESIFIPSGVKHSLENFVGVPLIIIEVRTGEYFGEDDVIRFDNYHSLDK